MHCNNIQFAALASPIARNNQVPVLLIPACNVLFGPLAARHARLCRSG
jgi:hypothetical protein